MEELDGRVLDLIESAVFGGAYSALARQIPEARRGLTKMYEKWHARTAILAADVGGAAFPAVPR